MKRAMLSPKRHSISCYIVKAMSIYDNKTSKIYPDLNPTELLQKEKNPPDDRLVKITKVASYFMEKIWKKLAKKKTLIYFWN